MNKRLFILSFLMVPLITSCIQQPVIFEKHFFGFSTVFNITSYNEDDSKVLKGVSLVNKYNNLFDAFNEYENINNIYTINNTNEEVVVNKELFNALELAKYYFEQTKGYFNPYLGELSFAYKEAFNKNNETNILELPSKSFVDSCLQNIDEFELILNKSNFTVQRKGNAKIDLGAFGKGFAIQKVKELFKENDVQYYFINGGNSSTYFTSKVDGSEYKASIKYLNNKYIKIKDASLGVSSVFEQLVEVDGRRYTHIIDPFTGKNESPYDFAIVKHEDPLLTDIFSTVLMILNDEQMIKKFSDEFDFSYSIYKNNEELYSSKDIEFLPF